MLKKNVEIAYFYFMLLLLNRIILSTKIQEHEQIFKGRIRIERKYTTWQFV